jgi:hypothetical protein
MAYSTINKSTDHFNTKLYAGNSGTNNITGVGFQPDFVWIKKRNATGDHALFDAIRGVTKRLQSNENSAEATTADSLTSFDSDGFTLGSYSGANQNLLASWNWKAAGSTASNSSGSITSTVSANTTAGFSIVSYTGTAANATVGHGLGVVPKVVITKSRVNGENWGFYHENLGNTKQLVLNTNAAQTGASAAYYNNTSPTSTVFSIGTADSTNDNQNMIAYCFAEIKGYSKFGAYTGNGQSDGTFVYTGFAPSFVLWKKVDSNDSNNSWVIMDNKRSGDNHYAKALHPDLNNTESDYQNWFDIYSNGFKLRNGHNELNRSGSNYIFMAFGQSLVGSNNVVATAR